MKFLILISTIFFSYSSYSMNCTLSHEDGFTQSFKAELNKQGSIKVLKEYYRGNYVYSMDPETYPLYNTRHFVLDFEKIDDENLEYCIVEKYRNYNFTAFALAPDSLLKVTNPLKVQRRIDDYLNINHEISKSLFNFTLTCH